jgi:hypothetical protein
MLSMNEGYSLAPVAKLAGSEDFESVRFSHRLNATFTDISSEIYREYRFPNGKVVRITRPLRLLVCEDGTHLIFTADKISHQIPPGWIHLFWDTFPGEPNFVS